MYINVDLTYMTQTETLYINILFVLNFMLLRSGRQCDERFEDML